MINLPSALQSQLYQLHPPSLAQPLALPYYSPQKLSFSSYRHPHPLILPRQLKPSFEQHLARVLYEPQSV